MSGVARGFKGLGAGEPFVCRGFPGCGVCRVQGVDRWCALARMTMVMRARATEGSPRGTQVGDGNVPE